MGKFCLVQLGKRSQPSARRGQLSADSWQLSAGSWKLVAEGWQLSADSGAALIIALMAMFLLTALGTALVLNTSTELAIAANFRISEEALYAADAAAERALVDLQASADWDSVLNGASPSSFIDGPPTGVRRFAGGTTIDLTGLTHSANCGHASACTSSEMSVSTVDRPWGSNNPVWRPYAYGPAETLAPEDTGRSSFYVVVWVGDDQSETDGDPQHDGQDPLTNPGSGVIALRVEAFGPQNARKALHLTLQRGNGKVRVISWRSLR